MTNSRELVINPIGPILGKSWACKHWKIKIFILPFFALVSHFLSFVFACVCDFCFALSFFCHFVLHFIVILVSGMQTKCLKNAK